MLTLQLRQPAYGGERARKTVIATVAAAVASLPIPTHTSIPASASAAIGDYIGMLEDVPMADLPVVRSNLLWHEDGIGGNWRIHRALHWFDPARGISIPTILIGSKVVS
jgi:hypothetical protein